MVNKGFFGQKYSKIYSELKKKTCQKNKHHLILFYISKKQKTIEYLLKYPNY